VEESLVRRTDVVERTVNAAGEQKNQDSLSERIQEAFPGKRQMLESYSPLTLAYIGDAIYDLVIRTVVVGRANRPANILHHITVKYVSAGAQARIVTALQERFTQEEQEVYRRGKNAKPHTTAKNASPGDYRKATGFEAVLGWLYLKNEMERVLELVREGISAAGLEKL
jgi:ribonuclease-3 family protein